NNELAKCKNLYEARLLYSKMSGKLSYLVDRTNIKWKGQQVTTNVNIANKMTGLDFVYFNGYNKRGYRTLYSIDSSRIKFIYNDLPRGAHKRCIELGEQILLINDDVTKKEICKLVGF